MQLPTRIAAAAAVPCVLLASAGTATASAAFTAPRTAVVPAVVHAETLGGYDPVTQQAISLTLVPGSRFYIAYAITNPNDFPVSFESITFDVSTPQVPSCASFIAPDAPRDFTSFPRTLAAHETEQPLADNHQWYVSPAMGNDCQGVQIYFTPHPVATAEEQPTTEPSETPTTEPTETPTVSPTETPTGEPTSGPTGAPTSGPTESLVEHPIVLEVPGRGKHELAHTGASLLPLGAAGAGLLALGAPALVWSRRRPGRR